MKRICSIVVLVLLGVCATAQTEVKGKIEKVTVFPNSALVEKSITASLQKGENKFVITGNALNVGTADIHFSTSPDWFISSMYSNKVNLSSNEVLAREMPQAAYSQYQTLKSQLNDVTLRLDNAKILVGTLNQQASALQNLKAIKNTVAFDTLVNLKEQLAYQRKELQAINSTKTKTAQEIEELQAKQRQLTDQVDALVRRHTGGKKVYSTQNDIYVTVYATKNIANAKITFSYKTIYVSSGYSYDVMLDEEKHQAVFSLKSNVSQSTGEHWSGCPIVFSTQETGYAGYDPALSPYYLNYAITHPVRRYAAKAMNTNMARGEDGAVVAEAEDYYAMEAVAISTMEEQTLSREYLLQTSQTIPSGEDPQTILLHLDTTAALFARYATPKLQEKVLFTALLPEWENLGLLDASCNVYLNNKFVSVSDIITSGTGDTMRFAVGQDPNVLVSRKLVKSSPDKGGMLSKEITEKATITLTLKNTKSEEVVVNLKDQVPISNASDLKVTEVTTDGGALEEKTGIVRWRVALKPLEQKKLTLTYTVKYPKEREHQVILR